MPSIFISYSRKDEVFARRLAVDLERLGVEVWIDVDDISAGQKWSTAVQKALDSCDVMIVVISPDSMNSQNVEDEWQYFLDVAKPIIPVRLHPATLHFQLARIQYVDFATQDYPVALDHLQKVLQQFPLLSINQAPKDVARAAPAMASPAGGIQQALKQIERGAPALAVLLVVGVVIAAVWSQLGEGGGSNNFTGTQMTQTAAAQATMTPTMTPTPAGSPNQTWTPVTQDFDGVPFVYVPAGCFRMGSTNEEIEPAVQSCQTVSTGEQCDPIWYQDEKPAREVCLSAYWIGRTEVTNAQYKRCVDAARCTPPHDRIAYDDPEKAGYPVVYVDWDQANTYAQWIGGSLPTETQWEYAARGPEGWVYPWGQEFDGTRLNFCDTTCPYTPRSADVNDGYAETAPAESYLSGQSWVGALNMSGNVWEWTADWYSADSYSALSGVTADPTGPAQGKDRTVRGSSWREAEYLTRAADRYLVDPAFSDFNFGFRVVESTLLPLTSLDLTQAVTPGPEQAMISLPPSSSTPIPAGSANRDWTPITQFFGDPPLPFVYVPAGCFMMGSDNGGDDEQPVIEVCLDAFWIGQTEVTNKQYGSSWSWPGDERPRETVNWLDARKFCEDRGGRLPTEAEWEYAARGPEGWEYPWGDVFVANNVVFGDNSYNQTVNVGSRLDGASWVGALDMSGNVWEWTSSLTFGYPYDVNDGRENLNSPDAISRVLRGGGWESDPATLRGANRDAEYQTAPNNTIGFRCARSAEG